jgi:hypothetical protein
MAFFKLFFIPVTTTSSTVEDSSSESEDSADITLCKEKVKKRIRLTISDHNKDVKKPADAGFFTNIMFAYFPSNF